MTLKDQKFELWCEKDKECERRIGQCLNDPSYGKLVEWLLETQTQPCDFLPEEYAGSLNNIHNFDNLCGEICRSQYTYPEMIFVLIDDEPKIFFDEENNILNKFATSKVTFLEIEPNDFGKIRDEYDKSWIKKCFLNDAKKLGKGYAAGLYRLNYSRLWDDSWLFEK